jgi:MFS family permease
MAFSTLFTAFLLSTVSSGTFGLYCSAILFGISMSSIPTVAVVMAGEYVAPTLRSTAAGFVTSLFGVGQLIGPALGGYIIDSTKVFSHSFLIAAICSFSGLIGALKLKNPKTK